MKPVYQTIIARADDSLPGNCMQAAVASLLELDLNEVPHFLMCHAGWFSAYYSFLMSKGIEYSHDLRNPRRLGASGKCRMDELHKHSGIKGYFFASVYSPGFFTPESMCSPGHVCPTHAVIIDKDYNIVHDPNPNYKGLKEYPLSFYLDYNGVLGVHLMDDLYGMYN